MECICEYCGMEYEENEQYYDDICDDCAIEDGILDEETVSNEEPVKDLTLYHGSPNKFTEFDYSKIRTNGTTEGVGFYFTDSEKVARTYGGGGYLYKVTFTGKKPLSDNKVTMSEQDYKKLIKVVHDETNYLENYGEVGYEGYETVLERALESDYQYCESDADIMGSIYNACGENERIVQLFNEVLGYDYIESTPDWGNQKLYIALTNNIIKIEEVIELGEE